MLRKHLVVFSLLGCIAVLSAFRTPEAPGQPSFARQTEQRMESLISQMSIEEKIGQLVQSSASAEIARGRLQELKQEIKLGKVGSLLNVDSPELALELQKLAMMESRLKIPLLFGLDVIHGYRTIFPIPLGEAASFHPELAEESARIAALEASSAGVHWTFAPMVDIARDPRWGRIAEGSGEDPYLGSEMAAARVRGFQGPDLRDPARIAACAKHYLGYGFAEGGRDYNTADFGPRTLREIVLPPFAAAIDAGVGTVMSSFNEIDGEPVSGSRRYLTDLLRGELGFQGLVVSDWDSISELVQHGVAVDSYAATVRSINAGVDMDMHSGSYSANLSIALQNGDIDESLLNEAVRRVLRLKLRLGLFENPYRNADPLGSRKLFLSAPHRAHARRVARESIVLLKNEDNVLPFSRQVENILVIGPMAQDTENLLGTWAPQGDPNDVVSVVEGIRKALPGANVTAVQGCDFESSDTTGIAKAVKAAGNADIVILAVGETKDMSGENSNRSELELPGVQEELIVRVTDLDKPTVVIVLSGRPNALQRIADSARALLIAWHPGVEAGNAIADVLFGDYNPAGRLPASFPRVTGQTPVYYNHKNTGRPFTGRNEPRPGYVDLPAGALFPFGFGLSYTTFEYSGLQLSADRMRRGESLKVQVTVQNTGNREGEEVVQLYIRDPVASVTRPVRTLRRFTKIRLRPQESRTVFFALTDEDLAMYDLELRRVVEPGRFDVFVGGSSTAALSASFTRI